MGVVRFESNYASDKKLLHKNMNVIFQKQIRVRKMVLAGSASPFCGITQIIKALCSRNSSTYKVDPPRVDNVDVIPHPTSRGGTSN